MEEGGAEAADWKIQKAVRMQSSGVLGCVCVGNRLLEGGAWCSSAHGAGKCHMTHRTIKEVHAAAGRYIDSESGWGQEKQSETKTTLQSTRLASGQEIPGQGSTTKVGMGARSHEQWYEREGAGTEVTTSGRGLPSFLTS